MHLALRRFAEPTRDVFQYFGLTPAGLVSVRPAFLRRVFALYAILAVAAVAIPALITKPRGSLPHLNEQAARRPAARDAAADAPGR